MMKGKRPHVKLNASNRETVNEQGRLMGGKLYRWGAGWGSVGDVGVILHAADRRRMTNAPL